MPGLPNDATDIFACYAPGKVSGMQLCILNSAKVLLN